MRVRPVGADGLLLEVDDPTAWFAELWRRRAKGEFAAVEIVPGATTVLLAGLDDATAAAELIRSWPPPPAADETTGDLVEVPVTFDGQDLFAVAAFWGTSEPEVVQQLTAIEFRVAFCGFVPGFAYLTGLPSELAVPRLETPRPRVPAGSVALADAYAGIYPTASPGGWRLVGRTDVVLFDPPRDPPALLYPGTRVRFIERVTP